MKNKNPPTVDPDDEIYFVYDCNDERQGSITGRSKAYAFLFDNPSQFVLIGRRLQQLARAWTH